MRARRCRCFSLLIINIRFYHSDGDFAGGGTKKYVKTSSPGYNIEFFEDILHARVISRESKFRDR